MAKDKTRKIKVGQEAVKLLRIKGLNIRAGAGVATASPGAPPCGAVEGDGSGY